MAYITRAELLEQVKELKAMVVALEENLKKSDEIISLQEENIQLRIYWKLRNNDSKKKNKLKIRL